MSKFNYSKKTILLTGAGGPAPFGMITVLRDWGYRIIAVDMLSDTPAFFFADAAYVVPAGNSNEFIPVLRYICQKEKVNAIVSVVDEELSAVLDLEKDDIQVIQPQKNFVDLCLNKYKCMKKLKQEGLSAPETWKVHEVPHDALYPLFIKPNVARGSRGIGKVYSKREFDTFINDSNYEENDLIVQPYYDGEEFTVSVIVWRDGEVQAVVPKKIIRKVGVTQFAVTRKNKKIESLCLKIQKKLKANGPFNVQLRLDKYGTPRPFEINPRFSTSITLTMAAGVDELGGILSQALFGRDSHQFSKWKEGIVLIRSTQDHFITESEYQNHPIELL